jgi:hypothetical protein
MEVMQRTAILLLTLALLPCVMAQSLDIEVVDYRHSSRYIDKKDCYRGSQNGVDVYLTETILKIRVTEGGAPIPDADVRIVYEARNRSRLERKEEYFRTDVWGEAEIKLPLVEEQTEVTIDAVARPKEGVGGVSGSKKIVLVPYGFRNPREFLTGW